MYIGGLQVDKLPCDCGAPYAETCIDVDGYIKPSNFDDINSLRGGYTC